MRSSSFFAQVDYSRALLARQYKRDSDGQFAGDGEGGGAPPSGKNGVRGELAVAESTRAVAVVFKSEMKRITGRPLPDHMEVDFEGSDVQIAREHAEGILRGLEKYPNTKINGVRMADLPEGTYGRTITANNDTSTILFGRDAQRYGERSYRADLKQQKQAGELATGTPMGVALHEFGHAVTLQTGTVGAVHDHDAGSISHYARTSANEAAAEAFADVMVNGKPKPASKAIMGDVNATALSGG